MSDSPRKNRIACRPTLGDIRLEERVVLNATAATRASLAAQVSTFDTGGGLLAGQTGLGNITARQLFATSRQQLRASQLALRQFVDNQLTTLYSDPANLDARG